MAIYFAPQKSRFDWNELLRSLAASGQSLSSMQNAKTQEGELMYRSGLTDKLRDMYGVKSRYDSSSSPMASLENAAQQASQQAAAKNLQGTQSGLDGVDIFLRGQQAAQGAPDLFTVVDGKAQLTNRAPVLSDVGKIGDLANKQFLAEQLAQQKMDNSWGTNVQNGKAQLTDPFFNQKYMNPENLREGKRTATYNQFASNAGKALQDQGFSGNYFEAPQEARVSEKKQAQMFDSSWLNFENRMAKGWRPGEEDHFNITRQMDEEYQRRQSRAKSPIEMVQNALEFRKRQKTLDSGQHPDHQQWRKYDLDAQMYLGFQPRGGGGGDNTVWYNPQTNQTRIGAPPRDKNGNLLDPNWIPQGKESREASTITSEKLINEWNSLSDSEKEKQLPRYANQLRRYGINLSMQKGNRTVAGFKIPFTEKVETQLGSTYDQPQTPAPQGQKAISRREAEEYYKNTGLRWPGPIY